MRTAIAIVTVLVLLMPSSVLAASPQNYCTSIQVQPPQNTGEPYTVTVTAGSGSYWRVREYPSGPVVIPAVYDPTIPVTLVGVLTAGQQYQVQAAHSSGGSWSTSGCVFTAESALGAYFEYAILDGVVLEWLTMQEPLWFSIWEWGTAGADGWAQIGTVPSANPHGTGVIYRLKVGEGDFRVCGHGFFGWITDCEDATWQMRF